MRKGARRAKVPRLPWMPTWGAAKVSTPSSSGERLPAARRGRRPGPGSRCGLPGAGRVPHRTGAAERTRVSSRRAARTTAPAHRRQGSVPDQLILIQLTRHEASGSPRKDGGDQPPQTRRIADEHLIAIRGGQGVAVGRRGPGRGWISARSRSSWPGTVPVTPDSVTKPRTRHALQLAPAEIPHRQQVSANDGCRQCEAGVCGLPRRVHGLIRPRSLREYRWASRPSTTTGRSDGQYRRAAHQRTAGRPA